LIFLGLWLALMLAGRSRFFIDPGSLWHIVVGRQVLSEGELPHVDAFSCTFAGRPWIAQWWLGECLLALFHNIGGLDTVLLGVTAFLAWLYAWLSYRLIRMGMHPLIAVLVVALACLASSYHFHPRPHLITIALVGWTFARLCDFEVGRTSLARLFWLVPLYALWANVHGGMVGGVATIAAASIGWGIARLIGRPTPLTSYRQFLILAGLVLACGLMALVNPYGIELPRVWLELMGSSLLPRIMQEHGPLLASGSVAWTVVLFGAVYLATLLGVPFRQWRVTWLLPLLWFAMTWTRIRHGPLFVITAALALAEMYPHVRWREWLVKKGSITCQLQPTDPGATTSRYAWGLAVVRLLLVLIGLGLQAAAIDLPLLGRGWARLDPASSPVDLLPELQKGERVQSAGRPIFNDMLFGGLLIYSTPNWKVFIDDRCELYGDRWLERNAEAYYEHPEQIEAWADEYGFDRALVIPDSKFDQYLQKAPGWAMIQQTPGAVLYRRATGPASPKDRGDEQHANQ
jgi:hypothetical protein